MEIIEFLELARDKKMNHNGDEASLFDEVSLTYLTMMSTLVDIEKHIIYALIMRPRHVAKDNLAKKDLSNYLTAKDLSDEVKMETKSLSVYLKRLVDTGLIDRKLINGKDYEYNVIDELFVKWFTFRNKKPNKHIQTVEAEEVKEETKYKCVKCKGVFFEKEVKQTTSGSNVCDWDTTYSCPKCGSQYFDIE